MGVSLVKYHIFSGIGIGKENNQWVLNPHEWTTFYKNLIKRKGKYKTKISYQPVYARKERMWQYFKEGYRGCVGRTLSRISIFPDGKAYICSYLFDTDLNFADIKDGYIHLNKKPNEFDSFAEPESCKGCKFYKTCFGGCPAEEIVTKVSPCREHSGIVPVCRLWKSTV